MSTDVEKQTMNGNAPEHQEHSFATGVDLKDPDASVLGTTAAEEKAAVQKLDWTLIPL
jgi:hypothetical protein